MLRAALGSRRIRRSRPGRQRNNNVGNGEVRGERRSHDSRRTIKGTPNDPDEQVVLGTARARCALTMPGQFHIDMSNFRVFGFASKCPCFFNNRCRGCALFNFELQASFGALLVHFGPSASLQTTSTTPSISKKPATFSFSPAFFENSRGSARS